MKLGVYIHIPFCRHKCAYCDFPSYSQLEHWYDRYVDALRRDIAGQGILFPEAVVDTVYIGGGTPTVLPEKLLTGIVREVWDQFSLATDAGVSVEANPGTVTGETLVALKAAGVNRISFGVQAFDDQLLARMGRIHSANQSIEAVRLARQAGINNISIDLMVDLPGQSAADWERSLQTAVGLGVNHLSAYGLKIEEGTVFAEQFASGLLSLPDDDEQAAMYDLTNSYLAAQGYERYEISNYARPGCQCRHNLKYWRYQPYLGIGAAAHSFLGGERIANTNSVERYVDNIMQGFSPVEYRERLASTTAMAEYCFLHLRMAEGICLYDFSQQFGVSFAAVYGSAAAKLAEQDLLIITQERVRLSPLGMKYGNQVFCAFLP